MVPCLPDPHKPFLSWAGPSARPIAEPENAFHRLAEKDRLDPEEGAAVLYEYSLACIFMLKGQVQTLRD
jgi:hypothetical protein